jgi:hypothetical protein
MRSFLTEYVRGKKRTLKYEFAVLLLGVLIIYIVRILLSSDPAWIAAQQGVLGIITVPILTFVGAVVGLQIWQNREESGPGIRERRSADRADDRGPSQEGHLMLALIRTLGPVFAMVIGLVGGGAIIGGLGTPTTSSSTTRRLPARRPIAPTMPARSG